MLAMKLHQHGGQLAQHIDADRLIVDRGAACAIGGLCALHHNLTFDINVLALEKLKGLVAGWQAECCRHSPLALPRPNQGGIAPRSERKTKRIEQDGLARAGLSGQHGKAGIKLQIQLFNENNVADGKGREHARHYRRVGRERARGR